MDGVVRGGEFVRYAAYIERTYVYTYTNLFEYEPGEMKEDRTGITYL